MKLAGLSNYKIVKDQVISEYQKTLNDNLVKTLSAAPGLINSINLFKRLSFWRKIACVASVVLGVLLIAAYLYDEIFPSALKIVFIVLVGLALGALLLTQSLIQTRLKNLETSTFKQLISQFDIYKQYFEKKYENVKVVGSVNSAAHRDYCKMVRGTGVPADASVQTYTPGLIFLINGREFYTHQMRWYWERKVCTRGSCYTQNNYLTKFYITNHDWAERWNGFVFDMSLAASHLNKGKELENDAFNKAFSYEHNDPVRLRILLTPFVQESFVALPQVVNQVSSWEFDKNNNFYASAVTSTQTPFAVNPSYRGVTAVEELAAAITKDLIADISYVEAQLSIVTTFRELVQ